jgi:hypothetical protein
VLIAFRFFSGNFREPLSAEFEQQNSDYHQFI